MNFYENVCNQGLYNKAYMVNYIAKYICFMNTLNASFFLYISCENVNYDAINSLTAKHFLLDKILYNHCSAAMRYILGCILEKYFSVELKV